MSTRRQDLRQTASEGLLKTIFADESLRLRLGGQPADQKTVVLSMESGTLHFSHAGSNQSANQEPHDTAIGLSDFDPTIEQGFVPLRRIATMLDAKRLDVEYRLVGQLGSGGTGVVYQAHQRAVDREVAVKVLRENLARDPQTRQRFLKEARLIGALDHPNVIALHELCVDESGALFYSMKRIDGTSWDQRIAKMTEAQNIETLLRVADAISYAHSLGWIHRDIKPENVMLGRFGEVLLADWELAVNPGEQDGSSALGGTPAYMAPELATGDQSQISFHTDVYLLGAVLFHILTGRPPHDGESLLSCIQAAANNEIHATSIESELMDIAMKAMESRGDRRYGSVADLIEAIESERSHRQSARLVRRAVQRVDDALPEKLYESFGIADALLSESLEIWPENTHARQTRVELNLRFAALATEHGDFDVALLMYETAGMGDSVEANRVREERDYRNETLQQESRYSALFIDSPEAGMLISVDTGRIVEANRSFLELFGFRKDEIVGVSVGELNLWKCPEQRGDFVNQLRRDHKIDNFETRFLRKTGDDVDVLISCRVTEIDGESMVVAVIRDISVRKQAEDELKQSRQRLKDFQRLAHLATWSYDIVNDEVDWSDETFKLTGRRRTDGIPSFQGFLEHLHPDDRDALRKATNNAIDTGLAYEIKVRLRKQDGTYRDLLSRGKPILDRDGNATEIYGIMIAH